MPATKITELTAISTVNTTVDPLPIVDVSDTTQASSGTTKKITVSQIDAAIFGASGSKAIVVDNVAALKALTVSGITDGQLYITRGYYSDNDGGQGTYIYDSASAATDNGGTVIAPTAGAGRFLLQYSGELNVKQFGAKGDGVTDDTSAFSNLINSGSGLSLFVPKGNFLITDTLNVTVDSYSLIGEKTEKGAYQEGSVIGSKITFNPTDKTKYLVNKFKNVATASTIGPFEHRNLYIDLGTVSQANGFKFGNDSAGYLPISDLPTGGVQFQAVVLGVVFDACNFIGTSPVFYSTANGDIVLSAKKCISLCKSFESVISDCSFVSSGHCVYTIGCDKPTISNCRAASQIPIEFVASGTFSAQHTVDNFQSEGWMFSPIISTDVSLCASNVRLECNIAAFGSTVGSGVFSIPTCTASVTANSASVVFSRSMTNVLFPEKSIVRLSDGTNTDDVMLTSLSGDGLTGTVDVSAFRFTWTSASATVVRVHNFGPVHKSVYEASITNASITTVASSPCIVYRLSRGSMYVSNGFVGIGSPQSGAAAVIGNRPVGASSMNGQLSIANCDVNLVPDVKHPIINVSNWASGAGNEAQLGNRLLGKDSYDSESSINRKWIYVPGRGQSSDNASENITFKKITGNTGTTQSVWAWFIDNAPTVGRNLWISDDSLPSQNSGALKVTIRYKSQAGGTTISVIAGSSSSGSTLKTITASDSNWKTETFIYQGVPTPWGTSNTSRTIQISTSADVYIGGIEFEDVPLTLGVGVDPLFGLAVRNGIENRGISSNAGFSNVPRRVLFSKTSGDSAVGNLSVTATINIAADFNWRNATIKTTASHINAYSSSQGSIFEIVQFRALNSASPAGFNVVSTDTNGSVITIAYAGVSATQLTVTATFNDTSVPSSVPTHELWISLEIDAPFQVTSIS